MCGGVWAFAGYQMKNTLQGRENVLAFKDDLLQRQQEPVADVWFIPELGELRREVYEPDWQEHRYPDLKGMSRDDQRRILYDKMVCDAMIGVQIGLLWGMPLYFIVMFLVPAVEALAAGSLWRRYWAALARDGRLRRAHHPPGGDLDSWRRSRAVGLGAADHGLGGLAGHVPARVLAPGSRPRRAGRGAGSHVARLVLVAPAAPARRLDCPGYLGEDAAALTPVRAVPWPRRAAGPGNEATCSNSLKNLPLRVPLARRRRWNR